MADSEWYTTTLGECADLISGGTPSKQNAEYWGGKIPWISAKDMKQFRLYESQDYITEKGAENGTRVVPAGTILVLVRGMTLHNDLPICITMKDMAFNQDVKAIQPKPIIVNVEYLAYWMLAHKPYLMSLVDSASHGTGRIHTDILKAVKLDLPTLPEQKAIARILSSLDDKIELNQQMNRTLEAIAWAIFKSWFVDFDPVRAKMDGRQPAGMDAATADLFPHEFEDSPLGKIPRAWKVTALGDLIDIKHGYAFKGEFFRTEPLGDILLTPGNFAIGGGFKDDKFKYYVGEVPESFVLDEGDLLVTMTDLSKAGDTLGYPAFIPSPRDGRYLHNQRLGKVIIKHGALISKLNLYYLLRTDAYRHEVLASATGTTVKHTSPERIKAFEFPFPPNEISIKFGDFIAPLYKKYCFNREESLTLTTIRDTLLQKLLSGEIQVKEAEKMVEAVA